MYRSIMLRGIRIGEAKNPGPRKPRRVKQMNKLTTTTLAVINPTAIYQKESQLNDMMERHGVHTFVCAETSATEAVQKQMTRQLGKLGLQSCWSAPVPPQRDKVNAMPSLRGKAAGTSIHSQWPIRAAWNGEQPHGEENTRMNHAIVCIGGTWLQLIALYGQSGNLTSHASFTNQLFHEALKRTAGINLPTIFAGDWNLDVTTLDSWEWLQGRGYATAQQLYSELTGTPMPFTCNEATVVDNAIIHPTLVPLIKDITVAKGGWFDTHHPVLITFRIDHASHFHQRYRIPKTWVNLPIDASDLQQATEYPAFQMPVASLQEWAQRTEDVVDRALSHQAQTADFPCISKLPKQCRGRCKPLKLIKAQAIKPCKPARHGDYNPPVDTAGFRSKQLITQVRRLQSLQKRIRKLEIYPDVWESTMHGIWEEWCAITRAHINGVSFLSWASDIPELNPIPGGLPEGTWLYDAIQLLKLEVDHQVRSEAILRSNKSKMTQIIDCQDNHKKLTYAAVKGTQQTVFRQVDKYCVANAIWIPSSDTPNTGELYVEDAFRFQIASPLQVDHIVVQVAAVHDHYLSIHLPQGDLQLPAEVEVMQKQTIREPDAIFKELSGYWEQFWQRSPGVPFDELDDDTMIQDIRRCIPNIAPMDEILGETLLEWKQALAQTKAFSAPGLDGFSILELRMLPDNLILQVIELIASFETFPAESMLAKTIPLPKKGKFTPECSRPITILSTLYRIWAKTCCTRISAHFVSFMPPEVTGMLPQKGAFEASYTMQVTLELARKRQQHICGTTLDLRKCFNLINRPKIRKLLLVFGIPAKAVHVWSNSLEQLSRVWVMDSHISHPTSSTCGCPEGDPWSVVAMLVIAACWIFLSKRADAGVAMAAYADNWSWWLQEGSSHDAIVQTTLRFTHWLGLEVDWGKTWIWGTSTMATQLLRDTLYNLLPRQQVNYRWYADDLGCPLTYKGNTKHGVIQDRLQEAKKRLKNLRNGTWNINIKTHMLSTAIMPVALYGSEVTVIGQTHLDQLRSQAASAVIGDTCRSMNPALCLHFADKHDLDPSFLVIVKALKAAKMYLLRASPTDRDTFLQIASKPSTHMGHAQGPASALREYLARVGWSVSPQGEIQMTALVFGNILTTPFKRLHKYILWAWEENLLMMHTERTKLFQMPPVDKFATLRVLDTFPPTRKTLLLREISGAFQTTHQKSQWSPDIQEQCQWCGHDQDTRAHRLLECKAFHDQRLPYQPVVEFFLDVGANIAELPVRFKHPHYELHDAIHAHMPCLPIDVDIVTRLNSLQQPLHFYTDGSLQHPSQVNTRYAAFSVVVDLCLDDQQRVYQADRYLVTKQWPTTLQQVHVARLTGEQCIHRAEAAAALAVFEAFANAVVFTDSACTISKVHTCSAQGLTHRHAMHPDSDLLQRFAAALQPTHAIRKVKAHQDLGNIANPLDRYHAIGNAYADCLAETAVKHLNPDLVAEWEQRHSDDEGDHERYDALCSLILQLQFAREQSTVTEPADQTDQQEPSPEVLLPSVQQPWDPVLPWNEDWLRYSVWGIQPMHSVQDWLQSIQWDLQAPLEGNIGISWTEIALSLSLHRGMWLPVKRKTSEGSWVILQPRTHQEALSMGIDLQEQTASAVAVVTQYRALVPDETWPNFCTAGKCASLYKQGFFQWTTGICPRPGFPGQSDIAALLSTYLLQHHHKLGSLPDLHFSANFDVWPEDREEQTSWESKMKTFTAKLHAVRKERRRRTGLTQT
eukprot:Skav201091  [mRNA]  locus=scaffold2562:88776:94007:+ [translate_table: standard]